MTDALYSSFARIFYSFKESEEDLSNSLNQTTGFAPRLREACQKALNILESDRGPGSNAEEILALKLERSTWDLVQLLYGARKTELSNRSSARELLLENPHVTPRCLLNRLLGNSAVLHELLITREWLQDHAPEPQFIESASAYRNFTRLSILHNQRSGTATHESNLVKELDPDVVIREPDHVLAAEDAAYEKALAHVLYTYIRAGQNEQATELCRSAHRPLLATALRGFKFFDWQAMSNLNEGGEPMDQDLPDISGNKRRRLWKKACTTAALDPNVPVSERVLLAALAPSRQTLVVLVKEACKTWEDHLWARVSTLLEEKSIEAMTMLGPNFWESGFKEVDGTQSTMDEAEFEKSALEETREVLMKMVDIHIDEGPDARDPFHLTQLRIILDQADSLLEEFALYLGGESLTRSSKQYAHLTRFFAHLCLFFSQIDVPISPLVSQKILEAYVGVLEEQGHTELIAQYAAALGDNAVSRYALFLSELPVSASLRNRRDTLFRAAEFGLDTAQVALSTADLCLEKAFRALPRPATPYPFISSDPVKLSNAEITLINAVDWLGFQEATYRHAIVRFNSVLRYFLCTGNLHACQELRERQPVALKENPVGNPANRYEYLHFERFFVAWAALGLADHLGAQLTRPDIRFQNRAREVDKYETTLRKAREQVIDLLTNNWLQAEEVLEGSDRTRQSELSRIREMYVPELIVRLHRALYESRPFAPKNVKNALLLANIVADSRYELYDAFQNAHGNRLGEYLQYVKEAVLGSLEKRHVFWRSWSPRTGKQQDLMARRLGDKISLLFHVFPKDS